jgi:hypothetical protein
VTGLCNRDLYLKISKVMKHCMGGDAVELVRRKEAFSMSPFGYELLMVSGP